MQTKKLLAIDLDGTTVTDEGEILPETVADLNHAREKGTKVCVITGRGLFEIVPFSKYVRMADLLVVNNGATIMDIQQNRILHTSRVDPSEAKTIISFCLQRNVLLHVNSDNFWGVNKITERVKSFAEEVHREPTFYSSLDEVPFNNIECFCLNDPQILAELAKMIEDHHFGLYTTESQAFYYNVLPKDVSKGKAIDELSNHLGIPQKDIIAVGNYTNDIIMFQHAGMGVAVQNATKDVKAAADYITQRSNNHNAVGEVVEKFILH